MTGCHGLPAWASLLAVVAHPDDESFGLGAVLAGFAARAAASSVLCFSHGDPVGRLALLGDREHLRWLHGLIAADGIASDQSTTEEAL